MTAEERDRVVAAIARLLAELAALSAPHDRNHPEDADNRPGRVDAGHDGEPAGRSTDQRGLASDRDRRHDPGRDWPSGDESS